MMALGALGVISVASNCIPADVAKLCALCLEGDFKAAAAEYFRLADFFDKLFIETNPIPVKAAMNMMGLNVGRCASRSSRFPTARARSSPRACTPSA